MMDRRTLLPAAIAALLVAGACGSDDGDSGNDNEEASGAEDVELTIWTHTHPPMVDLIEELVAEYESDNPHVTVNYETIPNTDFATAMLTALSAGSGPDIINMDDGQLRGEYIPKSLVAPVDPAAFDLDSIEELEERYVPGTLDGARGEDGQLYGVPSEFNATAFAINRAHFEDAGLDPNNPPRTWDEVSEYGQELVAAGYEGFNFLYLHSGWYTNQLQTLLNMTGGSILNEDGTASALTEPEAVEALEIWNTLINVNEVGDPDAASREATAPFEDFASGRRSMSIMYPWAVEQIAETNPDTFEDMEVVPLPQVDPANPTGRWYGYSFAVNQASEKQEEAWKLIAYLSSQHDRWVTDVSFIQPVQGWEDSDAVADMPFLEVWAEAYQQGTFDEVGPNWEEVRNAIQAAIERTIFDGVPSADSLAEAAEEIDRIISS